MDAASARHSALSHLAEQNVRLPLLMAKSRHTSLRSLQRYARPGVDAVAALTAATDPRPPAPLIVHPPSRRNATTAHWFSSSRMR
jgi:hypothetical protein